MTGDISQSRGTIMRKSLLAAAAVSLLAINAPASAERITIRVDHGDLDLSRPDQVELLEARIERAAYNACRTSSTPYSGRSKVDDSCFREATKAAMAIAQERIPAQVASAR